MLFTSLEKWIFLNILRQMQCAANLDFPMVQQALRAALRLAKFQPVFHRMTLGVQELNPHLTLAPIRIHTTVDHLKELVLSATLVVLLQVFSISVCITNAKSKFVSHFLLKIQIIMSNTEAVNLNNNFKAMLRKGKKGIEIHVVSKNPVQQVNGSN